MSVREDIVKLLSDHPNEFISGSDLGETLGISRSAVWRHIKVLRKQGYIIRSVTNSGYSINGAPDKLDEAVIKSYLKTSLIGRDLDIYRTIDSTNTFAKSLAELGAKDGKTIIADSQKAGRGRFDRRFESPPGGGIFMSVITRPKLPPSKALLMTFAAAVAVTDALKTVCGLDAGIKWVNDILSLQNSRKLCGILAEASVNMETSHLDYAVIGIGINVNHTAFPAELKKIATSVFLDTKTYHSRSIIAAEILNALEIRLNQIESNGFIDDYRARSVVLGRAIQVIQGERTYDAVATEIDDDGRLIVFTENKRTVALSSGSIRLL